MNELVCGQLPRVSRACAVSVCQYIILAIETVKLVGPQESVQTILVALCTCIVLIMRYESFATRKKIIRRH